MSPKISIVTPLYNSSRHIGHTLRSVLAQTESDWEAILVDDGSTDDTEAKVAPYLADSRFSYIKQTNRGIAGARNTGIRRATGEWVCFLDHDDRWLPQKLRKQLAFAASNELDLLGTDAYLLSENSNEPRQLYSDVFLNTIKTRLNQIDANTDLTRLLIECNFLCSSSVMIKRALFDRLGLLNEAAAPADDYDMWLRCTSVASVGYLAEPLIEYHLHESNYSRDFINMIDKEIDALKRNRHLFASNAEYRAALDCRIAELTQRVSDHRQVAARSNLDNFHHIASDATWSEAWPFLRQAFRLAPAEVLRPRRLLAVVKRTLFTCFKRTPRPSVKPSIK